MYNKNIKFYHEVRGFEQALIQQVVTAADKQYIISMKNLTIRNFTGDILEIFCVPHVNVPNLFTESFELFQNRVIDIHYDTVTPVDNIYKKIKYFLKYGYRGP